MSDGAIRCRIYRSPKRREMYLYLAGEDAFSAVPDELRTAFGAPEYVMELELDENRKLAREDVVQVMANLRGQGFHLQMPPDQAALQESVGSVDWGD